jgi:5'-nucleotidase
VGNADITFDDMGKVTNCGGSPIFPVSPSIGMDGNKTALSTGDAAKVLTALKMNSAIISVEANPDLVTAMKGYDAQVKELKTKVIGSVTGDKLCLARTPGDGRSTICTVMDTYQYGSDITNLVAKAFMFITPTADIGIQNGGGVRVDVEVGDLSMNDAFTLLPFSNTIVTLAMTGTQVKQVLEDALTSSAGGGTGSYPYASGLRFDVDMSKADNMRVSNIMVNKRVAGEWTAMDMMATYSVVTNNYIAAGKDGYTTFGTLTYADTYKEYAQAWIDYVLDVKTVSKLPVAEYSTQKFTNADGITHTSAGSEADVKAGPTAAADMNAAPKAEASFGLLLLLAPALAFALV